MTVVLETIDLTKRFAGIIATNNVSLQVAKGARHALIGPNGAGKTTLINLLTGVQRPTSGRIVFDGEDIGNLPTHQRVRPRHRPHLPDQSAIRRPDAARDDRAGGI